MKHSLAAEKLTKVFAANDMDVAAVSDVSFAISGDDFFTMLGPSGCGKTTTLRMIAGLESVTSGRVLMDGSDYSKVSAFQRGIGMVFQSYALFPHMTVFENTAYGLRLRGVGSEEIKRRVGTTLETLGLSGLAGRHPADLSGGQQQRVSIARALVYEPKMLLLDEPLANLDAKLRVQMREEIRRLQKSIGIMTIYVTHDQEEAMSVSDRIGVFDHGRLKQFGTPADIYASPASLFVADFIGKANFFRAESLDGGRVGMPGLGEIIPGRHGIVATDETAELGPSPALIMVRPEHMRLALSGPGIPGRVARVQFLGPFTRYVVTCDAATREVTVDTPRALDGIGEGSPVSLGFAPGDAILYARPA